MCDVPCIIIASAAVIAERVPIWETVVNVPHVVTVETVLSEPASTDTAA